MARREQFVNNFSAVLDGAINDSTETITLDTAAGLPSEGDFRLQIDAEVVLVRSRSGVVCTATRAADGTSASSHSDAAQVDAVATRDAITQLTRDNDPWAGIRPPFRIVDTNGDPLTDASFSEVNFTDGAVSSDANGNIVITKDDHASNSVSALVRSAPSTPYTITAAVMATVFADTGTSGAYFGILFRDSGDGKLITNSIQPSSTNFKSYRVISYTTPTSGAAVVGETRPSPLSTISWLRMEDDGVDLKWYASADGVNWQFLVSHARGTHFTTGPDQIGFFIDNVQGRDGANMSLLAWDGE